MKKIAKRIVASLLVALLVAISGLVTIIFSPQPLFANKLDHEKFTIYSDTEFDEESFKLRLNEAYELITCSELHDSSYNFDILLAHDHFFNNIESLQGKGPIARATAGYITIKVPIVPKENYAKGNTDKVNLSMLLAHEMVHVLQANTYGFLNFSPIKHPPMWKLEGYPEYISRREQLKSTDYSLVAEVDRYLTLRHNSSDIFIEVTHKHFMPVYYYKGRLMVEYLMDVRGMSYDQILKDERAEEEIFNDLVSWTEESNRFN
jgi:hypothetical protein